MSDWYYSDYERNRLGPVAARDLADLHHAGQLQPDTLVWREGMPQWRAWREVMTQALNEAAGLASPAAEAVPLSAGVNPYAMAEPVRPAASTHASSNGGVATSPGAPHPAPTLSSGANPYAVAEPHSPYAPPRAAIRGGSDYVAGGEVVYAGFWKRFAAYTIDTFVLGIVFGILGAIMGVGLAVSAAGRDPATAMSGMGATFVLFYIVEMVGMAVYFAWMHSSSHQATLGKMAVGIKVTDDDGGPITFWRGFGRFFATILSSLILCIGYLMAAFTDRKRALHDMVAGTLVVDRWAFTGHPERQRHELGTLTVVISVLACLIAVGYLVLVFALIGLGMAAGAR